MIKSKQDLKEIFSAGNLPTTQDYADLIDSLYGAIESVKTSIDSIDWEADEYVPTAKAIYNEFSETIEAIQDLIDRTGVVEQRLADFEARIKEYDDVDWSSDSDIPTANAVRQYAEWYVNNVLLNETEGCLYV